ncbi:hypothetical protein AALP_AA8G379400 [Arabis alpina]|uniref:Fe2OG dioxygenase domain-containing protein n=1 Tax=Arabis alpina TaxID=50452 RepID=A0A087GC10_ARAAL|nr:hypothetical protein AALP_AA8G379400 [Arabis alpina]
MSITESHPPALRSLINDGEAPVEPVLIQDKDIQIPVIDLERLDKEILTQACKELGIFRLENHGIPLTLTSRLQEISESLFRLPSENKREMFAGVKSPISYFSGTGALSRSGDALKRDPSHVNLVEGLNVPLSKLPASKISCDDDDSQEAKLESFRVLMEEYGRHMSRIAVSMFEAMVQTLNLELSDEQKSEYLSESTGNIRVYRYTPSSGEALGLEVHTDSSVIAIIKEDEVGGLQIMKGEEWFRVTPVANTLIINLGDMMQVISDDEYKSVKHRVKVEKSSKTERHSVCYFVFPKRESVIKSSKYKPFTYAEFEAQVQADVKSHGTKIGLPRFTPKSPLFL